MLLLVGWQACKGDAAADSGESTTLSTGTDTPSDFDSFYALFHSDSAFQMEHIAWPLDGNLQAAEEGGSVDARWQAETWVLHKPLDLGDNYVRELDVSSPDLVVERIKTTEGSYIIERRFAKFGPMWMLIYYRVADIG